MKPNHDTANLNQQTELNDERVKTAAQEAVALVRRHGFGVALPIVVATTAALNEWGPMINCWNNCTPPPPGSW